MQCFISFFVCFLFLSLLLFFFYNYTVYTKRIIIISLSSLL